MASAAHVLIVLAGRVWGANLYRIAPVADGSSWMVSGIVRTHSLLF